MPILDIPEELEVQRHVTPRKRLNHKRVHRYRDVYKYDGFITKLLLVDADGSFEDPRGKLYKEINDKWAKDGSGMSNFHMNYSMGKRKRWLLPHKLTEELPEPDGTVATTSALHFEEQRTGCQHDFCSLGGHCSINRPPTNYLYNADLKEYSHRTEEGQTTRRGKFSRNHKIIESPEKEKDVQPSIHVQYLIHDFKMNKKIHNSERFRFWKDGSNQWCKPMIEGTELNKDVRKIGDEEYETGIREMKGLTIVEDSDEENEITDDSRKAPGFTVADCVVQKPKNKRQRARTISSSSWEVV